MTIQSGKDIGRYHILEQLGEGGMAVVYKAYDTQLEREVAIKMLRQSQSVDQKYRKRFQMEAKTLAKLNHLHIVSILDFGEYDGSPYLVMEYVPGQTLKRLTGAPMDWRKALELLKPIAEALAYAHEKGVLHRDVKPSNILISEDGSAMLSDFGIAKILELDETLDLTGMGVGVGTPEYMAPEVGMGEEADQRADLYSLGIVLYELVTGRKPYQADTPLAVLMKHANDPLPRPSQFIPSLPNPVERLLYKMLAKNKAHRFGNMEEIILVCDKLLAGKKIPVSFDLKLSEKKFLLLITAIIMVIIIWFLIKQLIKDDPDIIPTDTIVISRNTETSAVYQNIAPVETKVEEATITPTGININETQNGTTFVHPADSMPMMLVLAGEFYMGASDIDWEAEADEKPGHTIYLDSFYIDKYEVSNQKYINCVSAGACTPQEEVMSSTSSDHFSKTYGDYPAVYVSWVQATDYCAWVGRRLPTEAEWEKAARGTDGAIFPWGNSPTPNANKLNFARLIGDTTPVTYYENGASPYGALNMAGNVWEWVADWYGREYDDGQNSNPIGPNLGTMRVLRGGSWFSESHYVRSSYREAAEPDKKSGNWGFRCAMDAD